MTAEGNNDFFLSFGSDASPFSHQIAEDLEPGINKINELRQALAAYERQAEKSKSGSSPLGLTFEGLDAAAEKIERATTGFTEKFNGIVEKITGVANQLDAAMRLVSNASRTGSDVRTPRVTDHDRAQVGASPAVRVVPAPTPPPKETFKKSEPIQRASENDTAYAARLEKWDKERNTFLDRQQQLEREYQRKLAEHTTATTTLPPKTNTRGISELPPDVQARVNAQARAGLAAVTAAEQESARTIRGRATRTDNANDALTQANTKISKTMGTLAGHLEALDTLLKGVTGTNKGGGKEGGGKNRETAEEATERRINNLASEVQVGNTPSNPIPVVIVGGDPTAVGHPHGGAHPTPAARTATADGRAKDEVAAVADVVNAAPGTRKNPRALLPDERPYSPDEFVYPFGQDPKKSATRAFGLRSGENFGQYSNRVGGVQSRVEAALGGVADLTPEEAEALKLYKLSGRPVPKARSSALGVDRNGSYLPIQGTRNSSTPPDTPDDIKAILEKRDEIFRQRGNVGHSTMLNELLRDPRLTQDSLPGDAKAALSQIDKIMLNPAQGLGRGDFGQDQRVLQSLFGNKHNFTEDDVRHFHEGAARRSYIRDNGSAAWTRSMDERENQKVQKATHAQHDYDFELDQRQGEVDERKNSVEGRNAARESTIKTAGNRYRNAQGFINKLEGSEPFHDPARELVSKGLITEGEYPLASLRTPARPFQVNSLTDVDKAEKMLREQLAPVVNGLKAQLRRVRKPERIAEINDQLSALAVRTKTPSEIAYDEVNKEYLASKKTLTGMDQALLGHGETIPEIGFTKSGRAHVKNGSTASAEYLDAATYKNEMAQRHKEAQDKIQPFGLQARAAEMKRVAQVLADMHQEQLLGAVGAPRAEAEPETPLARPTASIDETQAADYYEQMGRKQLKTLVGSGDEEAAGELKRRQSEKVSKDKKAAEREARKAAKAEATTPTEEKSGRRRSSRSLNPRETEAQIETAVSTKPDAADAVQEKLQDPAVRRQVEDLSKQITALNRRISNQKRGVAKAADAGTESPKYKTTLEELAQKRDGLKEKRTELNRTAAQTRASVTRTTETTREEVPGVSQINEAISSINRQISDQTKAIAAAKKAGTLIPQFEKTVEQLTALKTALKEQRSTLNKQAADLKKAQEQLAQLQAEEKGAATGRPGGVAGAFGRYQGEFDESSHGLAVRQRALAGERVGGDVETLLKAVAQSGPSTVPLFRGHSDNDQAKFAALKPGEKIQLPLSSFSENQHRAEEFSRHGGSADVLFQLEAGAKTLRAPGGVNANGVDFGTEKEHLTAGHFEVLRKEYDEEEELYRIHIRALKDQVQQLPGAGSNSEPARRSRRSSASTASTKAASAASATAPTPEMLVQMGLITEGEARQLAERNRVREENSPEGLLNRGLITKGELPLLRERQRVRQARLTEPQAATTAKDGVTDADRKLSAANAEYAQTLNEELTAVRSAIKQAQNEIRNLRRRQERGTAGHAQDDYLGGSVAALQEERDQLKAELRDVLAGRKGAPAGGGGGRKPPATPPAPPAGSNPEPEEPGSNARLIPVTPKPVNRDLQTRLGRLSAETQRDLENARQSILNPVSGEDTAATRALQREALVRAAASWKSDPAMSREFRDIGDRSRSFGQAVGLDINRRGVRSLIREDIFPAGEQRMHANRLANSAESSGAGNAGAESAAQLRARYDDLLVQSSGRVRDARQAEYLAEERLRAVREAGGHGTADETRAELQLSQATRTRLAAEQAAARQEAISNGNIYQRATGRTNSFGKDLIRHGTNALENTIGYTIVFTGFEKLREVVHTGIEADAAFVRLKASLDANGISAGNLSGKLAEISATTATPLEHVIEAASELAGTFKSAGDIAFATNIAAQLANISQGTLTAKEAAVGLRDVVSAFGQTWVGSSSVAQKSIQETGDQIAHLSQLTGVSIKDITEGTTQIAQEAHDFGLNQRQSATLAAYVTQGTGESGEQAASQTSRMLATLYNGKTQSTLVKLGVATQQDFADGNIGKVLTDLISKYGTLNDESKQTIAAMMGTGIQARAFAALMNGGANAVKELNGTMDDTGALAKQNQAYLNTVAGSIKQLSEDFQNLGSTLAHLGAFDAIGLLAKTLDLLFKEFNKVFGGIAALMNSNPLTATLMHYTAIILEAAAAWRLFGAAATTALVRSGAVSATQLGVGVRNSKAIADATIASEAGVAGAVIPGARYERAGFGAVAGGLLGNGRRRAGGAFAANEGEMSGPGFFRRDVRSFLPGAQTAGQALAAAEAQVAATAAEVAVANKVVAEAQAKEAAVTNDVASSETAVAEAAAATAKALESLTAAAAAAAEAEAAQATVQAAGAGAGTMGSFAALGTKMNSSTMLKLGVGAAAGMYLYSTMQGANKHFSSQNEADDALLSGNTDPSLLDKTATPGGTKGFWDQYWGKGNFFQHIGNGITHTVEGAVGMVNPVNDLRAIGDIAHGHFGSAIADFGRSFGVGGSTGPSDASNSKFMELSNRELGGFKAGTPGAKAAAGNKTLKDALPKMTSADQVTKWLKDQNDYIDKHAKEIEKAGGNDKNAQAQIAYSINQLKSTLTDAARRRIAAFKGLSAVDILTTNQTQMAVAAAQQFSQMNKQSLTDKTVQEAIGQVIDDTGVPSQSKEYKSLKAMTDPHSTYKQRLEGQVTFDDTTLKSVVSRLSTVGQQGGVAIGSQEYNNLTQQRDTLLTSIQTAKTAILQQPIQLAQGLSQLRLSTGNTSGAVGAMQTQIAGLRNFNSTLDKDDPQYIANLQQIQQLKVQIAQTSILPQINQLQLKAASSNDPLVQAKANYQAALDALDAANAVYQAEYNAEVQAVTDAQKALDDYKKAWDGHARGDDLANLKKKKAALNAAQSNVNTTGTDPQKQQAQADADQKRIAQANADEQLTEAKYAASIAGIRNPTLQAQAQLTGNLQEQQRYQGGDIKSEQQLQQLKQQEIQLRAQIRDSIEADAESVYSLNSAIDKVKGDDVGAAQQDLNKARQMYAYAVKEYGKNSKQANDALAQLIQSQATFQDTMLAQINSQLDLQIAELTARGKAGDLYQASQAKVQEAQNALNEYLHKGGKKGTSTYNTLLGNIASAQRAAFDQNLQDQLATLDFQQQTYQITSSMEVQSLQQILKNKQLTLQEQRDITLKIKNLQESIRQQLTQGGLNIPSNITLPTAYDVRRSLGAGFAGSSTQVNTVNNNQQVTINNNVPNAQVAASIANSIIDLINQQTSMGLRSSSSTPRNVQTR